VKLSLPAAPHFLSILFTVLPLLMMQMYIGKSHLHNQVFHVFIMPNKATL
jgi:hypothetical protein